MRGDILGRGVAGVRSTSVIEAARDLEAGNLRLPRQTQAIKLHVVTLGTVAARGLSIETSTAVLRIATRPARRKAFHRTLHPPR